MSTIDWKQLSGLEWSQPSLFSRSYELHGGDRLVGSLEFPSAFGSRAVASAGGAVWTLKRTGFLSPKVTARIEGADEDMAVYDPSFGGGRGTVHLRGGEQLRLKSVNFWKTEWTLVDSSDRNLLTIHNRGVIHHGAATDVSEAARSREDLPMLIVLTWYVLVLYMEDAAGTAVTG